MALGVTYENIDDYLEGKTLDPSIAKTIEGALDRFGDARVQRFAFQIIVDVLVGDTQGHFIRQGGAIVFQVGGGQLLIQVPTMRRKRLPAFSPNMATAAPTSTQFSA